MRLCLLILLAIVLGSCSDNNETTKDASTKEDSKPTLPKDSRPAIDEAITPDFCGPAPTCSGAQKACPDPVCEACVTIGSNEHCGDCNDPCNIAHGFVCKSGKCECNTGFTDCLGLCVDTSRNDDNCGKCGTKCDVAGGLTCVAGICKCTISGASCSDAGVDAGPDDLSADVVPDSMDDLAADTSVDVSADTSIDTSGDAQDDAQDA